MDGIASDDGARPIRSGRRGISRRGRAWLASARLDAVRYCLRPGCAQKVARGYCAKHAPDREAARPNAEVRAWYHSPRWRRLRAWKLRQHPVCWGLHERGCGRPTTDVDHRVPHRGDPALFWNSLNLDAYCHSCHGRKTGHGQ